MYNTGKKTTQATIIYDWSNINDRNPSYLFDVEPEYRDITYVVHLNGYETVTIQFPYRLRKKVIINSTTQNIIFQGSYLEESRRFITINYK